MKLWIILFSATFVLSLSSSNAANVHVFGTVFGYDGKPLEISSITYADQNKPDKKVKIFCQKDGKYDFKLEVDDYLKFSVEGLFHNEYEYSKILDKNEKELNLDFKLSPIVIDTSAEFKFMGDFNDFKFDDKVIKTIKDDQGRYYADLPKTSDTLLYQACIINSSMSRSFNGTQFNFNVPDNGGDFRSGIISKERGNIRVYFDPAKFARKNQRAVVNSNDSSIIRYNKSASMAKYYNDRMRYDLSKAIVAHEYEKMDSIKHIYVDSLVTYLESVKEESARIVIIINLIKTAGDGVTYKDVEKYVKKEYAEELMNRFSPMSVIWKENYDLALFAEDAIGGASDSKYIDKMIHEHPDMKVRENTCYRFVEYLSGKKDDKFQTYYDYFLREFPSSKMVRSLKIKYSKDKKIEVGKQLPDFKIANLDKPDEFFTLGSLKGKYVLIDIWGTWCGPCLSEMKSLENAFNNYKDKNFTILSIAFDGVDQVKQFREKKWKMPWLHSVMPKAFESDVAEIFEVIGVPRPVLIDPDGKIIAMEGDLRGEKLEKALEKYISQKDR